MNKNKKFEEILDKCLERLRKGGSIEQCLAAYPEQAKELRPLLETAAMVKQVTAISPRPGLNAQLQQRLRTAEQEKPQKSSVFSGWSPRWATGVGIALVMVMAGGSTVAAASSSMPDSVLYPVKQATEQVRLKLTFSDVGKEELYATLADVRVKELDYLSSKSGAVNNARTDKIEQVRRQLNTALDKVVVLASVPQSAAGGVMTAPMMTSPPMATKVDQNIDMTPSVAVAPAPRPQFQATSITTEQEMKRAQLEERLAQFLAKREALTKVVDQAPNPRSKMAVQQAIKASEQGYGQTLRDLQNLDNGNNGKGPKQTP